MSKQAPVENVNRVPLLAGDGGDVDDPAVLVRLHLRQRRVMSTRGRSTRVRHSCLMRRAFMQVDVFTSEAYGGNPVAVVLEADGLATDEMQRFARWTNLSETTFVLPPTSATADDVLALRPAAVDVDVGAVGPYPEGSAEAFEVRAFFPLNGATAEDPVTGSLNASLAQWLLRTGRAVSPYTARQGTAMGRTGRVHVTEDEG